jgi:hypothetical protein
VPSVRVSISGSAAIAVVPIVNDATISEAKNASRESPKRQNQAVIVINILDWMLR